MLNHWNVWCVAQSHFVPGEYIMTGKIVANSERVCGVHFRSATSICMQTRIVSFLVPCHMTHRERRGEKPTLKFLSLIFRCLFGLTTRHFPVAIVLSKCFSTCSRAVHPFHCIPRIRKSQNVKRHQIVWLHWEDYGCKQNESGDKTYTQNYDKKKS